MSRRSSEFRLDKILFGAICSLLLLTISCKDPVEGCLDVNAANYNVAADDACPDCCTYPELTLEVFHSFQDSFNFSYDSIYSFAGNDATRFQQVIFYLSDFKLTGTTDTMEVSETIDLDLLNGGAETFKDDYTLVSRSTASINYDIGEIQGMGQFDSLSFWVGLVGNAALSNALTLPEDHPLALTTDSLWTFTEGYTFNRIIVIPDTSNADETRQFDLINPLTLVEIRLPFEQVIDLGASLKIPLKIDYKKWFSGIDFVGDSDSEIIGKIVDNTANTFSINN